ncbi:MAG: DUF29 domain-containing protein [Thiotrichaceae bacterium]
MIQLEYEQDFHGWLNSQINLLKQGRISEIDAKNLIEELESMAGRDRNELLSHFKILIAHLLKWQFQLKQLSDRWSEFKGSSWRDTIIEQRSEIHDQLENSPSLKHHLSEIVTKSYPKAVSLAVDETQLPRATFPNICPYTIEQLLDKYFSTPQ